MSEKNNIESGEVKPESESKNIISKEDMDKVFKIFEEANMFLTSLTKDNVSKYKFITIRKKNETNNDEGTESILWSTDTLDFVIKSKDFLWRALSKKSFVFPGKPEAQLLLASILKNISGICKLNDAENQDCLVLLKALCLWNYLDVYLFHNIRGSLESFFEGVDKFNTFYEFWQEFCGSDHKDDISNFIICESGDSPSESTLIDKRCFEQLKTLINCDDLVKGINELQEMIQNKPGKEEPKKEEKKEKVINEKKEEKEKEEKEKKSENGTEKTKLTEKTVEKILTCLDSAKAKIKDSKFQKLIIKKLEDNDVTSKQLSKIINSSADFLSEILNCIDLNKEFPDAMEFLENAAKTKGTNEKGNELKKILTAAKLLLTIKAGMGAEKFENTLGKGLKGVSNWFGTSNGYQNEMKGKKGKKGKSSGTSTFTLMVNNLLKGNSETRRKNLEIFFSNEEFDIETVKKINSILGIEEQEEKKEASKKEENKLNEKGKLNNVEVEEVRINNPSNINEEKKEPKIGNEINGQLNKSMDGLLYKQSNTEGYTSRLVREMKEDGNEDDNFFLFDVNKNKFFNNEADKNEKDNKKDSNNEVNNPFSIFDNANNNENNNNNNNPNLNNDENNNNGANNVSYNNRLFTPKEWINEAIKYFNLTLSNEQKEKLETHIANTMLSGDKNKALTNPEYMEIYGQLVNALSQQNAIDDNILTKLLERVDYNNKLFTPKEWINEAIKYFNLTLSNEQREKLETHIANTMLSGAKDKTLKSTEYMKIYDDLIGNLRTVAAAVDDDVIDSLLTVINESNNGNNQINNNNDLNKNPIINNEILNNNNNNDNNQNQNLNNNLNDNINLNNEIKNEGLPIDQQIIKNWMLESGCWDMGEQNEDIKEILGEYIIKEKIKEIGQAKEKKEMPMLVLGSYKENSYKINIAEARSLLGLPKQEESKKKEKKKEQAANINNNNLDNNRMQNGNNLGNNNPKNNGNENLDNDDLNKNPINNNENNINNNPNLNNNDKGKNPIINNLNGDIKTKKEKPAEDDEKKVTVDYGAIYADIKNSEHFYRNMCVLRAKHYQTYEQVKQNCPDFGWWKSFKVALYRIFVFCFTNKQFENYDYNEQKYKREKPIASNEPFDIVNKIDNVKNSDILLRPKPEEDLSNAATNEQSNDQL